MIKTIIQIWGKAGSGKTTTIKIIRNELERKYLNPHHTYSYPLPNGEIFEIFDCDGILIGISSMGDDLTEFLKNHLIECFDNCDIIIAASRVYNNVDKFIEKKAKEKSFRKIKATNYRLNETKPIQFNFNKQSAIDIVNLINEIKTGKI